MAKEAPGEIRKQLAKWNRMTRALRILNGSLAIMAIMSSLLVTTTISWLDVQTVAVLAFLAAASIALMHTFKTKAKANRVRRAWRNLNTAVILYESGGPISLEELVQEYLRGEELIGDVEIDLN